MEKLALASVGVWHLAVQQNAGQLFILSLSFSTTSTSVIFSGLNGVQSLCFIHSQPHLRAVSHYVYMDTSIPI